MTLTQLQAITNAIRQDAESVEDRYAKNALLNVASVVDGLIRNIQEGRAI